VIKIGACDQLETSTDVTIIIVLKTVKIRLKYGFMKQTEASEWLV
jgi:hypothetical protein